MTNKIQKLSQLLKEANEILEELMQASNMNQVQAEQGAAVRNYERTYQLTSATGFFKGKKPLAVKFPDGTEINTSTWKRVVEVILTDCNSIPEIHNRLAYLCGRVAGRDRVLLSRRPDEMRSPLKIDEDIYMETHYDTETLLRILTTRILNAVEYDYSKIRIVIRNK